MKLSSPILAFTLASTSLHAGIFLVTDHVNLALPGSTGSVMSIKLETETNHTDALSPKPTKRNSSTQSTVKPLKTLSKKQDFSFSKVSGNKNKPEKNKLEKPVKTANRSTVNAPSRAQVISIVYQQLSNHFEYPRLAQLHNWQGKVVLSFRVTTKGKIENIQVNHSSGFSILDLAAINSLKKIGTLPQLTTGIMTGMEIQLPVFYQLTAG